MTPITTHTTYTHSLTHSFTHATHTHTLTHNNNIVINNVNNSMEYIPDGVSKEQWAAIKKKEADANKGKNLGPVGITKFKSRSFEAWQKSGGKNLFPVDPSVPLEERPYMQVNGGWLGCTCHQSYFS